MNKRSGGEKQEDMWIAYTELTRAPGHPFYERLNEVLEQAGFDAFVEGRCARFYHARLGRPSLMPGVYFRSLLIGYLKASRGSVGSRGGWPIRWPCDGFCCWDWMRGRRTTRRYRVRGG